MKKIFALLSVAGTLLMMAFVSCVAPIATVTLSSIAVDPTTAVLSVGGTQTVIVTATYSDGSTAAVSDSTWSTSDAAVATVSGGTITGVAAGTATITATSGAATATVSVTVATAAMVKSLTSIAVNPTTATINVGDTSAITVTATYSDGSTAILTDSTWTTSDGTKATVASGIITGVATGTATITANNSGKTADVAVTVNAATAPRVYALAWTGTDASWPNVSFGVKPLSGKTITNVSITYAVNAEAAISIGAEWHSNSTGDVYLGNVAAIPAVTMVTTSLTGAGFTSVAATDNVSIKLWHQHSTPAIQAMLYVKQLVVTYSDTTTETLTFQTGSATVKSVYASTQTSVSLSDRFWSYSTLALTPSYVAVF